MKTFHLFTILSIMLAGASCPAQPSHPGIMLGAFLPGQDNYEEIIRSFDDAAGKNHTHAAHIAPFSFNYGSYPYLLEQARAAGKIPIITWMQSEDGTPDPAYSNPSFLRGDHDRIILRMAEQCKAYGDPIYMRWSSEMNIRSSPGWPGHSWNNYSAQGFIDMYRYVRGKFDEAGARNVIWIWSPNYWGDVIGLDTYSDYRNLYPGDDFVDMVGLSGVNYGNRPGAGPGFPVTVQWLYMPILRELMAGSYDGAGALKSALLDLARLTKGKPQGLIEFGCVESYPGRDGYAFSLIPKEDWIRQGYDALAHMDEFRFVRLIVWYNMIDSRPPISSDFRVARNPIAGDLPVPQSVTQAYREAVADPVFLDRALTLEEMTPTQYYRAPSMLDAAAYPQHEFWPSVRNGGSARKGAMLAAAYYLYPPINANPGNWKCDTHVAVRIPGGAFYAFVPPDRWVRFDPNSSAPPAAIRGFEVKRTTVGMAFYQRLANGLPSGEYVFHSILVPPGADPRRGGPDLKISRFTLAD